MIGHAPIDYSLLSHSTAYSLARLKDLRISHLGTFFQSRQFPWQGFPVRLPTLDSGSLPELKFAKEASTAN